VRDYPELTRKLADLIVGYGAGVQPGQLVGITSLPSMPLSRARRRR
jgi:leucyl aminopeptidase (aminopeptidase T)